MANKVFIAASLDGYIADRHKGLDFLETIPNPDNLDLGYIPFMESVDALLMGRNSFETINNFDIPWPYSKPVFVFSSTKIPANLKDRVKLVSGPPRDVIKSLNIQNLKDFYIDGGKLIQSFLAEDLIDEMIITRIPILLGKGVPLFGYLPKHIEFDLLKNEVLLNGIVQSHYRRETKQH